MKILKILTLLSIVLLIGCKLQPKETITLVNDNTYFSIDKTIKIGSTISKGNHVYEIELLFIGKVIGSVELQGAFVYEGENIDKISFSVDMFPFTKKIMCQIPIPYIKVKYFDTNKDLLIESTYGIIGKFP